MEKPSYQVLILMLSKLSLEPRVYRQLKTLSDKYDLTTAGYAPSNEPVKSHWLIVADDFFENRLLLWLQKIWKVLLLRLGFYDQYYWSQASVRSFFDQWVANGQPEFDLIIVHDQDMLPVCLKIAKNNAVLLDAHEYFPAQRNNFKFRWLLKDYRHWLCTQYMGQVAGLLTVSHGISEEYKRVYGISSKLIFNAPFYQNLQPHPVNHSTIRLVHHGIPAPERGLDVLIELFHYLDERFTLDFFLMKNHSLDYLEYLKNLAIQFGDRIRFLEPVPMPELPQKLNGYDIGLCMIQPRNFNYANCLPNKFFEFVQARLAVAIGPSPDMQLLCEQYQFGIISEDFKASSLANSLNKLDCQTLWKLKQKAHSAALELSAESSQQVFLGEVERILFNPGKTIHNA